jgi:hypothetical protein
MAITLSEAAELTQDKMVKGVIQTLLLESPLMRKLPYVTLVGNALAINREDEDHPSTVAWRPVNGTWTESVGQTTQVTFPLKVLGGDADVDNFLQKTRSNINDLMAAQVKMKSKAMAHEFEDCAVYGAASGTNQFDGLHTLIDALPATQQLHMGSSGTGAPLSIMKLMELIDVVTAGQADFILMNKAIRRRLTQYLMANASYMTARDEFGNQVPEWDGIPILTTDFIAQTEAISGGVYSGKSGGATSSVFAVHLGEMEGLVGLQNGGIDKEVWPKLESKDAMRTRLKWYVSMALYSTKALARIDGVTNAAVVAGA